MKKGFMLNYAIAVLKKSERLNLKKKSYLV